MEEPNLEIEETSEAGEGNAPALFDKPSTPELESPEIPDDFGEEEKPESLITFKRSHLYSVLIPLAFVVGLSVGYLFWGQASFTAVKGQLGGASSSSDSGGNAAGGDTTPRQKTSSSSAPNQGQTSNSQPVRYDVPEDDDPSIGPDDAEIVIIEFSDFECPFCKKWHTEVFERLLAAYPDQIRFVYRDFPLTNIHADAFPAAEAANCAGEQGFYWEFHNMLFSQGVGEKAYETYATQLGMDLDAFNTCRESGRYTAEVQADFDFAARLGVRSTPTFFINGIAIVGAQPFEVFQQVIEKELAGEFQK